MRILIIGGTSNSLVNFRGDLIKFILREGHDVFIASGELTKDDAKDIKDLKCNYTELNLKRASLNPFNDLFFLIDLCKLVMEKKPDIVLAYTIKPVVWSGIIRFFFGTYKFFPMVTGLGYAFQKNRSIFGLLEKITNFLYWLSCKKANAVIFQNKDNLESFLNKKIINKKQKCHLVNGSGVNLSKFAFAEPHKENEVLCIARLLKSKGIYEFFEAAKIIKKNYKHVNFKLIGGFDSSPDGISEQEFSNLIKQGHVEHIEPVQDVVPYLSSCSIFVLPSYHEGMPRTVLEAMAVGRPVVTTDVPGCRETVKFDNGILAKVRDPEDLAKNILTILQNDNLRINMGLNARKAAEKHFDVERINKELAKMITE